MYPIVLAIIAVIAVSILLIKVMPGFVSMFEGVGMELPALTRFVMGLSSFLVHNWIWILLVLFAVIFSIRVALQQKDIRIAWDINHLRHIRIVHRSRNDSRHTRLRTLNERPHRGTDIENELDLR